MNDQLPAKDEGVIASIIERASTNDKFDSQTFKLLLDTYREERSQARQDAYYRDMAQVQQEMNPPNWTGRNPTFNNPFPKLDDLDRAARPIYTRYGFSVTYGAEPHPDLGWRRVTITIAHREGHTVTIPLDVPVDTPVPGRSGRESPRTPIQSVMSSNTYAMRTLLRMAFNIVAKHDPSDDDGEALINPTEAKYYAEEMALIYAADTAQHLGQWWNEEEHKRTRSQMLSRPLREMLQDLVRMKVGEMQAEEAKTAGSTVKRNGSWQAEGDDAGE